jgi:hypothetical protein
MMKFFKPILTTEAILEDSDDDATYCINVTEPATAVNLWAGTNTYSVGDRVYYYGSDGVRKMFVAIAASSPPGQNPLTTWGYWEEIQLTEAAATVWAVDTTFGLGQLCYVITSYTSTKTAHKIFESVVAGNLGHHPLSAETGYWIEIGETNRWRMFDQSSGSYTEYLDASGTLTAPLVAWFDVTDISVDVITALDVSGADEFKCQFFTSAHAAITGYDEVSTFFSAWDTSDPLGWYWYFYVEPIPTSQGLLYLDKPPTGVKMKVTISQAVDGTPIRIGTLAFGAVTELGMTQFGASVGILDFSKKERDDFGVFKIIERNYAKTLSCDCIVENEMVSSIYSKLAEIRATPVIWIGSDEQVFDSTIVYGFYKSFNIVLESAGGSMCNLEIEGLA